MADDELVERRAGRDKHAHRPRPSSRAAQLLPGRRDGPRVADQHRALQAPDVDAQLERVGADDRGDVAVAQTRLDLAPVQRQVSGAIASHSLRGVESRREFFPQVAQHHLDLQPAAAEHDGLHAGADPGGREPPGFEHRAAPDAQVPAYEWRVVEDQAAFAAWCAAAVDERDVVLLEQPLRELERVADGR